MGKLSELPPHSAFFFEFGGAPAGMGGVPSSNAGLA